MQSTPIRYRIAPRHPEAHLFEVAVTVADPAPEGQRFALPAWIPGSYLIRDFARHVVSLRATAGGRSIAVTKLDKHTWQVAPTRNAVTVTIEVYAWDLSVRGAHLDTTHAFFNGPSVFLRAIGRESRACEVDIRPPPGARYRRWRVATALPRAGAKPFAFGRYRAADYDELIDHPVELGTFTLATFRAHGIAHDIAITGRHDADAGRLCRDLARVCAHHIDFFGRPAPFRRYLFLVMATPDGYGGLEHRASTALICARGDLPQADAREVTDGYRTFLGLASHEYFHAWMVKRIKPAAFTPYDLDRENYTRQLWAFEGITSYYDDLALRRTGLISQASYLELLGRAITQLLRSGGRRRQTVTESSFDAWTKYYRQDENAPNAIVSYYVKGALVAACADLAIRSRTRGRRSLDDVMRALWQRYGRTGAGVPETAIPELASEISGVDLSALFRHALETTEELPLARLLATHGLDLRMHAADSSSDRGGQAPRAGSTAARRATLGVRTSADGNDLRITHVFDGSSAQAAGVAPGDILAAIDGLRVTPRSFDAVLGRHAPGRVIRLTLFRRDELLELDCVPSNPPNDTAHVALRPGGTGRGLREAWLGS
jgi:predicted metalloprotease with PDZ domain